ncbi:hypothetical protein [Sphingobium scionense]|uniref:Tip attachment protein J domain-containing protein n=1 Tax=Sphingobium scionense TaxID=1404341 RepID=A0A7W6LTH3_9SPHN|nr:hypothetical protein [Sphingobium scionense]MBB4149137.1 hypothetical protein [Sphingobium scionense]
MSNFARKAALAIGAVALVATGVGAIGGLALGASLSTLGATTVGIAGVGSLSVSTLATISSVAGMVASMTAKRPSSSGAGSQTSFKADPDAAVPYVVGETQVSGNIVYWKSHGPDENPYQTITTILSGCGPIAGIDQTVMDGDDINFAGGIYGPYAIGGKNRIWQDAQMGIRPEPAQLSTGVGVPPGWTSASTLPSLAATQLTMLYDAKGDDTLVSTPKMAWRGRYVLAYDPRLDDTYPGGSGPCRALQEDTYVFTRNGPLHALTWAIGRWEGGKRMGGIGSPIDAVDVASFVEGANWADANGWTCDGQVDLAKGKWNNLKLFLQAGGCEPVWQGARLACLVRKPRVVLGTIPRSDIVGDATLPQMQTRRDRINSVIPRYRSADHDYEMVDAGAVSVAAAVTADGDTRTRRIDYGLVQCSAGDTPDQAAALAYLDAAAAREAGPIVLPLKPRWIGARFGDCWILPEGMGDLSGKIALIRERSLDPVKGHPTLTFLTEDMSKYPIALAQVGVPAPITEPSTPSEPGAPDAGSWSVSAGSGSVPSLIIAGECESSNAMWIEFAYRPVGASDWSDQVTVRADSKGKEITGLASGGSYQVGIRYLRAFNGETPWLILGPVTVGTLTASSAATADTATNAGNAAQLGGTYTAADITAILNRLDAADIP